MSNIPVEDDAPPEGAPPARGPITIINRRRGFGFFEGVTGGPPPKPAAGWLYDDKGRVRLGECGHPLRPEAYQRRHRGECRVCTLMAKPDEIRCYISNDGLEDRARNRWGSTAKRRRSANSYKAGGPIGNGQWLIGDFETFREARFALAASSDAVIDIAEVMRLRLCPEATRTIRFRHGPVDDPLVIGEPLPAYQSIADLSAMLGAYGSSIVYQQASMTSSLINYWGDDDT